MRISRRWVSAAAVGLSVSILVSSPSLADTEERYPSVGDSPGSVVLDDDSLAVPGAPDDPVLLDDTVPFADGGEGLDEVPTVDDSVVSDDTEVLVGDDSVVGQPYPVLPAPDPEDVRRLMRAMERVEELKRDMRILDRRAERIVARSNEAHAEWQRAALLAADMRQRAEDARSKANSAVAGLYMSGSTEGLAGWASALTSPGSLSDVFNDAAMFESFAERRVSLFITAQEVEALADAAEADAAERKATADAAVEDVSQARADMVRKLRQARKLMEQASSVLELGGFTVGQTVVGPDGCPTSVPSAAVRGGLTVSQVADLCRESVREAPTPQAALAIQYAFRMLGAPYACNGVGRNEPFRFDCSSLVSRAYAEGAGLGTAGDGWAPSTRDMVPWDGVRLSDWYVPIAEAAARPGDLALYDTGGSSYRHVVMILADGFMLHTNSCGDIAHVTTFTGMSDRVGSAFLGVRRVAVDA